MGEEESTWDPETTGFSSGEAPASLRNGPLGTWTPEKHLDLCIFIGRRTLIIAVTPEEFWAERGDACSVLQHSPDHECLVNASGGSVPSSPLPPPSSPDTTVPQW